MKGTHSSEIYTKQEVAKHSLSDQIKSLSFHRLYRITDCVEYNRSGETTTRKGAGFIHDPRLAAGVIWKVEVPSQIDYVLLCSGASIYSSS